MAAEYVYVCVFLTLRLYAKLFSKNKSLLLFKIYEVVAIFKCLKHSKR